jgi:uncharacterized phage protein gp47/JayE
MALTLEQVRTTITRTEALASLITVLQSLGFNATSWQTGSLQLTLLTGCAEVWAQMSHHADALSRFHFNEDSTGTALTAFSASHYDNERTAATYTEGEVILTGAAVGPPHVVAIGDLTVADDVRGYTFRNTTGGVVPAAGTLTLTFKAETSGADTVQTVDGDITTLQTPLAGVTVENTGPNWRTVDGVDAESDATLRLRNETKWSALSYATSAGAYEQFALAADSTVTRVLVYDSLASTGVVNVFCADNNGTVAGSVVTTVQDYIDLKKPLTADVTVIAATEVAQAFTAEIFITASMNNATKQAEIVTALGTLVNGLDIGGTVLPAGAPQGYLLFSELNDAISGIAGVEGITWTTPTADVPITVATSTVANVMTVGATTFTYTSI